MLLRGQTKNFVYCSQTLYVFRTLQGLQQASSHSERRIRPIAVEMTRYSYGQKDRNACLSSAIVIVFGPILRVHLPHDIEVQAYDWRCLSSLHGTFFAVDGGGRSSVVSRHLSPRCLATDDVNRQQDTRSVRLTDRQAGGRTDVRVYVCANVCVHVSARILIAQDGQCLQCRRTYALSA